MLLAFTQLFAQAAGKAPAGSGKATQQGSGMTLLIFLGIFVVFYVLMVLPENRRRKKLKEKVKALKQGDRILTAGGVVGTVDFVGEKTLYIKTQDAKIEIAKEFVSSVIE